MNFIEYLRRSETDSGRLGYTFGGDPTSPRQGLSEGGFRVPGALIQRDQHRAAGVREAERLLERVQRGDRWARVQLQEALTISDFSGYFGDVLDRSVLSNYAETPYTWTKYCKRAIIRDFRQAKIFRFDRGANVLDGPILPNSYGAQGGSGPTGIAQITEYPLGRRVESNYVDQLYKFGRLMDFSWETIVNDDLDALKDTPALFGRAARRTEEKRVAELFMGSGGPNSTFFSTANKNVLTAAVLPNLLTQYGLADNPHFSVTALQAAMNVMANQVDLDGEPISIEAWCLVFPPSLDIPVKNVLHATEIWANDQGGTTGLGGVTAGSNQSATSLQRLITMNWAKDTVVPAKNYYAPIVNTTNGNSAWFLFAQPSQGRPALQQSFLQGHEGPELFMKQPNQVGIGEGRMGPGAPGAGMGSSAGGSSSSNPMDGDFDTDSIIYKVRHVLGGTLLDPIMAVASTGVG